MASKSRQNKTPLGFNTSPQNRALNWRQLHTLERAYATAPLFLPLMEQALEECEIKFLLNQSF